MRGLSKIDGIRHRVRAWLFFTVCGLAIIWFGDYLEKLAAGMGKSVISLGIIWAIASFALLIVNLIALRIEKKRES